MGDIDEQQHDSNQVPRSCDILHYLSMKDQVTRGDEEGSPKDEAELLSEVRKFLHIFLFSILPLPRKAEMVRLLL